MPNPMPTKLSLPSPAARIPPPLTHMNNVFTYANNAFTHTNPLFAPANNVFALANHLPAIQLHNPVAPMNTVFTPANNSLAFTKATALFSIISRRSQKYPDSQLIENKLSAQKNHRSFFWEFCSSRKLNASPAAHNKSSLRKEERRPASPLQRKKSESRWCDPRDAGLLLV